MKNTMMKTFGSLTAKLAALLLAFGLGQSAWGATVTVATFAQLTDAVTAATAGDTIQLTADVNWNAEQNITKSLVFDLNGKTVTFSAADSHIKNGATVEFKNGNMVFAAASAGDTVLGIGAYQNGGNTLTLTNVKVTSDGSASGYAAFYAYDAYNSQTNTANFTNCEVVYKNDAGASGGIFKGSNGTGTFNFNNTKVTVSGNAASSTMANATINIDNGSAFEIKDNPDANGINNCALTVNDSTLTISNNGGRGITPRSGAACNFSGDSVVTISGNGDGDLVLNKYGNAIVIEEDVAFTATEVKKGDTYSIQDGNGSAIELTGNSLVVTPGPVAKIGDTEYATLAEALADVTKDAPLTWVSESAWPVATPVYYNGNFYAVAGTTQNGGGALDHAIAQANTDHASSTDVALIYVRPGYTQTAGNAGAGTFLATYNKHQPFASNIIIYGNNASLGGEAWEPSVTGMTRDMSVAIYNLHDGAGFWGQHNTPYVLTATMENCNNVHEYMVNGSAGSAESIANVTIKNCTFGTHNNVVVASTNPGTVVIDGCTFTENNNNYVVNINNKNGGTTTATISNSTFNGGGTASKGVVRVNGEVEGTTMSGTFENLTFNDTSSAVADIQIGHATEAADNKANVSYTVSGTTGVLKVFETGSTTLKNEGDTAIAAANSYKGDNIPTPVAQVISADGTATNKYASLATALSALQSNETLELLANATNSLVVIPSSVTFVPGAYDYTAYVGAGTSADPYQIGNLSTLRAFRDYVDLQLSDGTSQYAGKYFKLTSDIDLSGENWEPIGSMVGDHGSFKGVFDGDNHTIKNLSVQKAEKGLGFFSYTTGDAMIKNLTFTNVTVKSTAPTAHAKGSWVGGVVGDAFANTVISNVHVVGSIDIEGYGYVGGMVGHGYVKVYDSAVEGEGTIKGNMWCTGGIVGYAGEGTTDVRNSFVTGTGTGLTVQAAAGGCGAIVGMAEDDSGRSPISGSNLAATNVTVGTFVGGFGTSYATYCLGYLYGGNSDQNLSGDLIVNNVTFDAQGNTEPPVQDAVATVGNVIYFTLPSAVEAAQNGDATATVVRNLKLKESVAIATDTSINLASKTITLGTGVDYAFVLSGEGTTLSLANGTATVGTTGYPANYRLMSETSEGVTSYTAVACAAEIDGTPYRTFAEAIAAAEAYKTANDTYPVITVLDATAEQTNTKWKIDSGCLVRKYFYQDAENANLWHVENLAGLKEFRDSVNAGTSYTGKTVQLDNPIDLAGENWTPIGTESNKFTGIFDGQNNEISNLTIDDASLNYAGLFGRATNATFKKVKIKNVNITAHNFVGSLIGETRTGPIVIEDCTVSGAIKLSANHYVGGLAGQLYGLTLVSGCSVDGTAASASFIRAASHVASDGDGDDAGGLIGFAEPANISGCAVSNVTVEGYRQSGGLVGLASYGTVSNDSVEDVVVRCIADEYTAQNNTKKMAFGGLIGVIRSATSKTRIEDCAISGVSLESTATGLSVARMGYITGGIYATDAFEVASSVPLTVEDVTVENCTRVAGTLLPVPSSTMPVDGYVSVAKIGNTGYSTLAAALKAANSGDVIEILDGTWGADAVGADSLTLNEKLTIRTKSLTVQAAEGAKPKFVANVFLGYDDSKTVNASMTVRGLAFENAQLKIGEYVQVTVENCSFTGSGADAALAIIDSCVKTHLTADEYPAAQATVTGCTFDGTATGAPAIRIRNSGNVTITGNTVANSSHNGILLESNGSVNSTVSKTVIIKDNEITEWNAGNVAESGRGVRLALGTLAEGSTVTVEGNTFRKKSLGLDEPDFVKITGAGSAAVDISGNDWNDMLLSEVSGNSAIYSCDSASAPVIGSVITTKKEPVAQIGTTKYETVEAALADAQGSGATIEILANSTETPNHALEVLMGGDVTLTSETPVRVEIAPTAKTSSVDNDGMAYIRSASAAARCTFTVGENVTLAFPATAVGKGAMYIGYSAATPADMVINGRLELYEPYVGSLSKLTVNPSGSIKSISECLIVRWGATVDIVGTGAEWSDANPQAEFGYVWLQGGVTTLKDTYAKGGAWVQTWNRNADKVGQYGDTTLALDNSVLATSKINNQVVIAMDCDSQIVTPVVQNTGSINIDATGITAPFKAIDYTGSGTMALANYGTVNVTGGEAYVEESDLWVKKLPVAQIVTDAGATTTKYATLAAAVADAQSGDTIEMIADVTGENVTVTKSVTITGASDAEGNPAITLENTQLTLSGTMVELAVTNLAFTGSSYINANNGKALTVDHVTAVVDPTKCGNCSRSAFIVLSATEHTTGLDLTVTHSTIVNTSGTDSYGAAIFGWAYLKSATICDNVLGSDSYRFRFIAVKLMNAVDGATYTIERNMVYGTNARYRFYAFDLYQNCSRDNSYTAVSKDNVVDVTATGSYDFFVFDIERNGSVSTKTIVIDSDSTLNGKAVTLNDFRNELNVNAGFYGAGVVYDANGKMTAGTFNRELSDAELEEFVAEGLRSFAVGDGTYTLDVPVAQIGDVKYASFEKAIADAQGGDTILLLADATLDAAVTVSMSLTITLDGHSITGTITAGTGYELVTSDTAYVVRGAGYAGEVLPAGPDMSGDVINVTAANAQYTLDGAYGNINGKTINFTESVPYTLDLARPTKFSGSGTTGSGSMADPYSRTLNNVTFTSNSGVTLAGFYCHPGHISADNDYERYNYVNDRIVTSVNDGYYRNSVLTGITFSGLTINGTTEKSIDVIGSQENLTISGITFTGCTITNNTNGAIYFNNNGNLEYGAVSFGNCNIYGYKVGIYINGVGGAAITVTNNYIVAGSANNNAIQITKKNADGTGSVSVTGNFLKSDKYTVNLNNFGSNQIVFTGNAVVAGSRGHLGHFQGDASGNFWAPQGATPDASGNMTSAMTEPIADTSAVPGENDITSSSYYSSAVVDTSAVQWVTLSNHHTFVAQIGDDKYETFADAIAAAEEYKTANGDYPVITVLDPTAELADLDWKIADDKLVRKNVIATLAQGGAIVGKYEDLHEALEAGKSAGSVVTLLKDVDLAGVNWVPVGDATAFNGTFDGKNHIIRNLTGSGTTNVGLFGHAVGAAIRNVTISNVTFTASSSHVGALIGHGDCFTASNCVVIGTINISGSSNAGGLVGTASNAQWAFRDCLVDGTSANSSTVSSSNMVGGLAGNTDYEGVVVGCTVKNVTVSGPKKVGGLIGQFNYDNDANNKDASDLVSVSGTKVESVIVNCTATAQTDDYVQIGGLFGILYRDNAKSDFASVSITATVKNVTVNGIEASAKGAANAGIVSGGYRKKTVADSQTQLAGDNVVFNITFEGTNAVTGNTNYSDYIGIYNPAPYVAEIDGQGYLTFAAAIEAADAANVNEITILDDSITTSPDPAWYIYGTTLKRDTGRDLWYVAGAKETTYGTYAEALNAANNDATKVFCLWSGYSKTVAEAIAAGSLVVEKHDRYEIEGYTGETAGFLHVKDARGLASLAGFKAYCDANCRPGGSSGKDSNDAFYWTAPAKWTVVLDCNIDLDNKAWTTSQTGMWIKIDGDNHTVLNLSVSTSSGKAGLFTDCGLVSNLKLDGANVDAGSGTAGAVVAWQGDGGLVNVVVSNAVVSGKYVGGIVGQAYGRKYTGNVLGNVSVTTTTKYVGGIAGQFYVDGDPLYEVDVQNNVLNDIQIVYSDPNEIYGSVLGALISASAPYVVTGNTANNITTNGTLAVRWDNDTSDAYNALWAPRRPNAGALNPNVTYANNALTPHYLSQFVYPIEGTAGVPVASEWLAAQFPTIYPDATKPILASITNDLVTALSENGANNMPKWESYVLGLNPADATAVLRLTATAKDATTVTITGAIDTTKFPSIANVTVTFRLAAQNGAEWTDIATGAATPAFDVALDDVAGKVLAIFADIVTE